MKTILITLFFALAQIFTSAQVKQDTSAHMTFKGVPIDGTLNEYVEKLEKSGFVHIDTEDGIAMLKGDFAAYKNCIIGVSTLKGMDLVSSISVIFPEQDTWDDLSNNYFSLKELLTEKYGEPSESVEEFKSEYTPKDDIMKMYEVGMNRCKYHSTYETENGIIHLSIENDGSWISFVRLSYFDIINSKKLREKAIDDL